MAGLVDTSVVIAMERRGYTIDQSVEFLLSRSVAIASVTVSELLAGLYRAQSGQRTDLRRAFIETVIKAAPVLPFDLSAARLHASLIDRLRRTGQPIGANDVLIAATAMAHDRWIITENVRDFGRIEGLRVDRPEWPS